ncbi:MAG TPA: MBL fold metallo-hydrolase [Thermoplasmata archaeon]|nr:MBL fold metallo-hydrolase [Thermoplasmata archaeon]
MSEILPGVHIVDGVDPSPDFSTHVYLVKDKGPTYSLIDTGLPGADAAIVRYLAAHKIEPTSVKRILVTHLHDDHTGNLRRLAALTHARTFAHWLEAAFIAAHPKYDGPGLVPSDPVAVDETVKDGDTIDAAGGLIAYHTPGHTPGHTSYYQPERRLLFSGDLFVGDGTTLELSPKPYTHHTLSAQISARRMAQLSVEAVLCYHGGPFLKDAAKQLHPFGSSK